MGIVIKCYPEALEGVRIFRPEPLPVAKGCQLAEGDEAFIWFTEEKNSGGLAARGKLVSVLQDGKKFSLEVELNASKAISELSVKDLAKYDWRKLEVVERPGDPRLGLFKKLVYHSPCRVVGIEMDEAEFLRDHFDGVIPEEYPLEADRQRMIDDDLSDEAFEGESQVQKTKRRQRAYKLASSVIESRLRSGSFSCDNCDFDPKAKARGTSVNPRSLLDVHHINQLAAGPRRSRLTDFRLLCPNCHRFEHALLRLRVGAGEVNPSGPHQ